MMHNDDPIHDEESAFMAETPTVDNDTMNGQEPPRTDGARQPVPVDDPQPWAGYVAVGAGLLGQMEPLGILSLIGFVASIVAIAGGQRVWGWVGLLLNGIALVVNAPFWFLLAALFGTMALAA